MVAQAGADGDFDALQGIHDQQAEASIKVVQAGQVFQAGIVSEAMLGIIGSLEGTHVRRESKETHGFKEAFRSLVILNAQAALLEQKQLLMNVDRGFLKWPHAVTGRIPDKKNPLNLCVAAEATIGMAGVLPRRVGTRCLLGKVELVVCRRKTLQSLSRIRPFRSACAPRSPVRCRCCRRCCLPRAARSAASPPRSGAARGCRWSRR